MAKARKEINWDILNQNLQAGCTQSKICSNFNISPDTLCRRTKEKYGMTYADYAESLRSEGMILLETVLFQKAVKGSVQLLIWLSKVKLGYREPENVVLTAPLQDQIDKDHQIMQLKYEIAKLREVSKPNGDQPEAGPELQRSDPQIQHMGGGCEVGEDILQYREIPI